VVTVTNWNTQIIRKHPADGTAPVVFRVAAMFDVAATLAEVAMSVFP
jgi:hypothetical protein